MPVERIGITEFRARLTELLRRVQEQGASYVVTDRGRPVARLEALAAPEDEPAPAPAPARVQFASEPRRSILAAALHLTPVSFDERTMSAAYRFVEDGGNMVTQGFVVEYELCPKCHGRARVIRRDLDGNPVPEEVVDLERAGYTFLDPCDHCEGRRVVPMVNPNQMGWEREYLEYRTWELERLEADLWPFLHASKELDRPYVNPVPPVRQRDDDVPF